MADARYCFLLQSNRPAVEIAPLLCAGLIGYRALRLAGPGPRLGLYGFGAAAHLVIQIAVHRKQEVLVFTRPGDAKSQEFARSLGARWAGDSTQVPATPLDSCILFAPVGSLVPAALAAVRPGGRVICAGIHMSDIPSFPYSLLWEERSVHSVANLTRRDGEEFLELAWKIPIQTQTHAYSWKKATQALDDLRYGRFEGAAVLDFGSERKEED